MNTGLITLRHGILSSLLLGLILVSIPAAAAPEWWISRGVVDPQQAEEDYARLNVGQLKHMAAKARDELNATLPNGAGSAIDTLVLGWANTAGADDYAMCNLGQLKSVAKLYYDRLIAEYWATTYPWTGWVGDDDSYAVANIGQLKWVFNFGGSASDSDGDGLPDAWEMACVGSLTALTGWTQDADGDGLDNGSEYALRTHPTNPDTDGDNVLDGDEVAFGWNPKVNTLADTTRTESLTYDAAHRLTGVSGRSTLGYTPDANGNLTQTN